MSSIPVDQTSSQTFAFEAARSFVRTVVFVDDEVYATNQALSESAPSGEVKSPETRKHAGKANPVAEPPHSAEGQENARSESPFGLREMADAFANMGIVCALHQPKANHPINQDSAIFKICDSADICVLDWDMGGDNGAKTIALLAEMADKRNRSEVPPLQLVAIYTKRDNLFTVADNILQGVEKKNSSVEFLAKPFEPGASTACIDYLMFKTLRVITLGKPGTRKTTILGNREVREADLPERLIHEFARMSSGILQSAVISQMAVVRNRVYELLGRFSTDLDSAFLTHWHLCHRAGAEASEHLTPVILSEMESILEDSNIAQEVHRVAKSVLNEKESKAGKPTCPNDGCKTDIGPDKENKRPRLKDACVLHNDCPLAEHDRFAILLANRTFYDASRILTQGTIVKHEFPNNEGSESEYLICLQPLCDTVRLKNSTSFLFHVLDASKGKGSVVVQDGTNFIRLYFKPDVASVRTVSFQPDAQEQCVRATKTSGECDFTFITCNSDKFTWQGQLKKDHALRIVNQFASQLARVGLTESEWLRLLSK